ncbi:MAG: hypothetical protein JXQ23_03980 [Clostridia bacterium]|nr:hypothetical protein [Clostridia bacterium]
MKKNMNDRTRRIIILVIAAFVCVSALALYNRYEETQYPDAYHTYIEKGYSETKVNNLVTAIYLNYRVFDTVFEALLLAISVTAVVYFAMPWERIREDEDEN